MSFDKNVQDGADQGWTVFEAESGRLQGTRIQTSRRGYTGNGYVAGFSENGDAVEIDFRVPNDGYYDIAVRHACNDIRSNRLLLDGDVYGDMVSKPADGFHDWPMTTARLTAGAHTLTIQKGMGGIDVDAVKVRAADQPARIRADFSLVNQNPSREARALMNYLKSIYGKHILTGQHTSAATGPEIDDIRRITGHSPALRGFDLLSYSHNTSLANMSDSCVSEIANNRGSVEAARDWFLDENGIVTICWHWFSPLAGEDKAFYTEHTDFDLEVALTSGTRENDALINDLDAIAEQLLSLRDAGVPVLWRPLHEGEGRWFWWGAKGPDSYKKLWRLMFDKYTNDYQLNNLIWVWSSPHPDWYPGDDCVDIVGMDIYVPRQNYGPLRCSFDYAVSLSSGAKPVALTEDGPMPHPEKLAASQAAWLWYMPWWGGGATYGSSNTEAHVAEVYKHPYTLTLGDLPSWRAKD